MSLQEFGSIYFFSVNQKSCSRKNGPFAINRTLSTFGIIRLYPKMQRKLNFIHINYNSFGVNVKAKEFIEINSNAELLALKEIIKNKKVLFLGGGSNILFTKDYNGTVIHLNTKGISVEKQDKDTSVVKANSGENWNDLIEFCLENNLGG